MGAKWDDFKNRVGEKTVGAGMIVVDILFLFLLAGLMSLADLGREWVSGHLGQGGLFTRVTLIVVEVLLDLSVVVVVGSWLWDEIKRLFR